MCNDKSNIKMFIYNTKINSESNNTIDPTFDYFALKIQKVCFINSDFIF